MGLGLIPSICIACPWWSSRRSLLSMNDLSKFLLLHCYEGKTWLFWKWCTSAHSCINIYFIKCTLNFTLQYVKLMMTWGLHLLSWVVYVNNQHFTNCFQICFRNSPNVTKCWYLNMILVNSGRQSMVNYPHRIYIDCLSVT